MELGDKIFYLSLPVIILASNLIASSILWKRLPAPITQKALPIVAIASYALTLLISFTIAFVSALRGFIFSSHPYNLPVEMQFADNFFALVLNPCYLYPTIHDHVGEFIGNSATFWYVPLFFYLLGLLPGTLIRHTPKPT